MKPKPGSGNVLHLRAQYVQHRLPARATTEMRNPAVRIGTVDKCDGQGTARQKRAKALWPFDQTDGIDERILDAEFQRLFWCLKPIQIKMHDQRQIVRLVGLHKGEGRAGDIILCRTGRLNNAARQH